MTKYSWMRLLTRLVFFLLRLSGCQSLWWLHSTKCFTLNTEKGLKIAYDFFSYLGSIDVKACGDCQDAECWCKSSKSVTINASKKRTAARTKVPKGLDWGHRISQGTLILLLYSSWSLKIFSKSWSPGVILICTKINSAKHPLLIYR